MPEVSDPLPLFLSSGTPKVKTDTVASEQTNYNQWLLLTLASPKNASPRNSTAGSGKAERFGYLHCVRTAVCGEVLLGNTYSSRRRDTQVFAGRLQGI